jgi:hypothetical protein
MGGFIVTIRVLRKDCRGARAEAGNEKFLNNPGERLC